MEASVEVHEPLGWQLFRRAISESSSLLQPRDLFPHFDDNMVGILAVEAGIVRNANCLPFRELFRDQARGGCLNRRVHGRSGAEMAGCVAPIVLPLDN